MSARRPGLRSLFLLVLASALWIGASFPTDDAGRPAPWCSYLDDSITPAVSVVCSVTRPLPAGNSGVTSIATDTLGYGRTFFLAPSASSGSGATVLSAAIFVDEVNVVGYSFGTGATLQPTGGLQVATSNDGGRTWNGATNVGCPSVGGCSSQVRKVVRTVASIPTYIIASVGPPAGPAAIARSTSPIGGFTAVSIATITSASVDVAVQGATVMVVGTGVGGHFACRSDDAGATFQPCVLVDATGTGSGSIISPSQNIWIASNGTGGDLFRSTDNGATWASVLLTGGGSGPLTCVSGTVCLFNNSQGAGATFRSTDAGVTWTSPAGSPGAAGSGGTFCTYGNNVVDFLQAATASSANPWPTTTTQTTTPGFRSTDGGISWVQVPVTGGVSDGTASRISQCVANTTGRAVLAWQNNALTLNGFYYGPTSANTVQIVGANGIPLSVDANGNFTGNQGLPQATSPNAWGVVPVQGPALKNSTTTGAANTATAVTIAAVAGQRVHLRRIDAYCDTAGTATTLTVTDGATVVWPGTPTAPTLAIGQTLFTQQWAPSLDSTTGNALTVTLGACGIGNAGTVTVHADQF